MSSTYTPGWHWEWCPACGITGVIQRRGEDSLSVISEQCECCDGIGRIKVPNGYSLKANPIYTVVMTTTTSSTGEGESGEEL